MFRLNGDIIKQLENIYEIKFLPKFKNDLRDRILIFINSIMFNIHQENFLQTLLTIQEEIVIEKNVPILLTDVFFENHKQELFNSFNPIWYAKKEVFKHYNVKELYYIADVIVYDLSLTLEDKYIPANEIFSIREDQEVENIQYSKKLYKKILNILENSMFGDLNSYYFREQDDAFIILETIKDLIDNHENSEDFLITFETIMEEFIYTFDDDTISFCYHLYYLDKIKDKIKELSI